MDLLLLNDRIGGRVKEGGIVFPRFVKPNRRLRGTEDEQQKDLSDTFLSSMGSRMLMNAPPSARTRPMNPSVTATSSDQNPLFLIQFPESNQDKPISQNKNPPKSVRSLYHDRFKVELECCAGRAQLEHIGSGHSVLMDCTPRAMRAKKNELRKHGLVKETTIAHPVPYPKLPQVVEEGITSRLKSNRVPISSRSEQILSSRSTSESIRQVNSKKEMFSSRSEHGSARFDTNRTSRNTSSQELTSRSEKDRLETEMKNLEKKLNKIEDMLEIRSSRSTRSNISRQENKKQPAMH